jgi:hypothetical protein
VTQVGLAILAPVLALASYRHSGLRLRTAGALTFAAVVLSLIGLILAFIYLYAIDIEAGLCGSSPVAAKISAGFAYVVVAAWAARDPRRVWAWPLACAAAAVLTLVSYFFTGAHVYCET